MKRTAFFVLPLALLLVGVGSSAAHTTSYPTDILDRHFEGYPGNATLSGRVSSENVKCIPGRLVKLIVTRGDTGAREILDVTRTSRNGAYGLNAGFNGNDTARVKVFPKNIGPTGHKHTCLAKTVREYKP